MNERLSIFRDRKEQWTGLIVTSMVAATELVQVYPLFLAQRIFYLWAVFVVTATLTMGTVTVLKALEAW